MARLAVKYYRGKAPNRMIVTHRVHAGIGCRLPGGRAKMSHARNKQRVREAADAFGSDGAPMFQPPAIRSAESGMEHSRFTELCAVTLLICHFPGRLPVQSLHLILCSAGLSLFGAGGYARAPV